MAEKIISRDYESEYNCLLEKNKHLESVLDEMRKRCKAFENQINQANEDYTEQAVKYDELEEKYQKIEFENSLNKAKLRTFEYCIEHIFGK